MANRGLKLVSTRTSHAVVADKSEIVLKETDNRFTSPDFVEAIVEGFGKIDFDPCWHPDSAVRPKRYLDVRRGDDGLRDDWYGQVMFVNPPWSAQDKWLKRGYSEWAKGNIGTLVYLVPAKTDAKVFHEVLSYEADIFFIKGRPKFFKKNEKPKGTKCATMLVVFGASNQQKVRIAALLNGAWWSQSQFSAPRIDGAIADWSDMMDTLVPVSCVAQRGRGSVSVGILCKPAVGCF